MRHPLKIMFMKYEVYTHLFIQEKTLRNKYTHYLFRYISNSIYICIKPMMNAGNLS